MSLVDSKLINVIGLGKSFKTGSTAVSVLKGINLTFDDGELIAIVGPSGSGKSTLLSILGLLDEPTSGELILRGQSVTELTNQQKTFIRNNHVGWIFQNFNLIASMTALENVALPLRYNAKISSTEYESKATVVLNKVGLENKLNAKPDELSGGQQQRVAIARALVNNPALILADEPTGNLDSATGQSIVELLKELAKAGATVIIVTHDPDVAIQCDRKIHIVDGCIQDDC
jgi:putative ABC transport system ATP-binding protein